MNKIVVRRLASFLVFSAAAAAILTFYGSDLQSIPVVQQFSGSCYQIYLSCMEIYRNNPTIGAFLLASAIGIPAGLALSMVWPRNGLFSVFGSRRTQIEDPRA